MGIKYMSYKDLSQDQRTRGATKIREQLRAMLMTPLLTDEQRAAIFTKLSDVSKWERGEIEVQPPPAFVPKGVDHSVEVSEDVPVAEDVG